MNTRLWNLDAATYSRHPLHTVDRIWPQSNCSFDMWVELLHVSGAEPLAAMPFTLAVDLEGDQWTFFKFPLADLSTLYGVEVFEVNVWRSLVSHIGEQVGLGRPVFVEVDAFDLPDTAGTSYGIEHVKSSIGVQAIDRQARRLGYFHNDSYYELSGADFDRLFDSSRSGIDGEGLPPYVEAAKLGEPRLTSRCGIRDLSLALLASHLARRPAVNPFRRFAARFQADLEWLVHERLAMFHRYAFATLRQCGAAFDLAGHYLRWLDSVGENGLREAVAACDTIAATAKTLQFKTARAVNSHRVFDATPLVDEMAGAWDDTMALLVTRYGQPDRAPGTSALPCPTVD